MIFRLQMQQQRIPSSKPDVFVTLKLHYNSLNQGQNLQLGTSVALFMWRQQHLLQQLNKKIQYSLFVNTAQLGIMIYFSTRITE